MRLINWERVTPAILSWVVVPESVTVTLPRSSVTAMMDDFRIDTPPPSSGTCTHAALALEADITTTMLRPLALSALGQHPPRFGKSLSGALIGDWCERALWWLCSRLLRVFGASKFLPPAILARRWTRDRDQDDLQWQHLSLHKVRTGEPC
jgi:hypothetical protein